MIIIYLINTNKKKIIENAIVLFDNFYVLFYWNNELWPLFFQSKKSEESQGIAFKIWLLHGL